MSTLTIANSCISQQEKEGGVLPNVTRKRGAVKNTACDLSFISDTSGSHRYKPFFNAKSFAFDPYRCSSFDITKRLKDEDLKIFLENFITDFFVSLIYSGFPVSHSNSGLWLTTRRKIGVRYRVEAGIFSLMLCPDRSSDSPSVSPNAYKTKHCLPSNA